METVEIGLCSIEHSYRRVIENAETSEKTGVDMKSFFEEEIKDKVERLKTKLCL